ncbi:lysine--tRNA ligase [Tanacetum coccineum]
MAKKSSIPAVDLSADDDNIKDEEDVVMTTTALTQTSVRWTRDEEKLLSEVWVRVSENNDIGNDRNEECFWGQIHDDFNKIPMADWIDSIARDWKFKRIIPSHFAAPVNASRSDFIAAFGFLDLLGERYVTHPSLQLLFTSIMGKAASYFPPDDMITLSSLDQFLEFNPSEIVTPKLMKNNGRHTISLGLLRMLIFLLFLYLPCQMALSAIIKGGVPLVFCPSVTQLVQVLYGDPRWYRAQAIGVLLVQGIDNNAVGCVSLVNMFRVRDFAVAKKLTCGLGRIGDKALRPADILLYSWDGGLDVCVDLTGSSPLTRTGMTDFAPGRAVIDRLHNVAWISFAIAKGVGAQIVSRLPSNLL